MGTIQCDAEELVNVGGEALEGGFIAEEAMYVYQEESAFLS